MKQSGLIFKKNGLSRLYHPEVDQVLYTW